MLASDIIAAALAHAYELPERDTLDRALSIPLLNMGIAELTDAENAFRASYTPPKPKLIAPIFVVRPEDDLPYDYHITVILLPLWLVWKVWEGMDDSRAQSYRILFEQKKAEVVPAVFEYVPCVTDAWSTFNPCPHPIHTPTPFIPTPCVPATSHYNPAPPTTIVPPSLNDEPYPLDDVEAAEDDPTDFDPTDIEPDIPEDPEPDDPGPSEPDEPTQPVQVVIQNDVIAGIYANYLHYIKVKQAAPLRSQPSTTATSLTTVPNGKIIQLLGKVKDADQGSDATSTIWWWKAKYKPDDSNETLTGYIYPDYAQVASGARSAGTKVARAALSRLGCPYELGARTDDAFDCSGLVYYAVRMTDPTMASQTVTDNGTSCKFSSNAATQAQLCNHQVNAGVSGWEKLGEDLMSDSALAPVLVNCRPGDLIFWYKPNEDNGRFHKIRHAGVYAGKFRGPDDVLRSYCVEATTGSSLNKVVLREVWTKASYGIAYIFRPAYNDSNAYGHDTTRAGAEVDYTEDEKSAYIEAVEFGDE